MDSSLSKSQLRSLRLLGYFDEDLDYSEEQVREAVGMNADEGEIIHWEDAAAYVFYKFDKYSTEFKREVRASYIKEMVENKHMTKEEATKKADGNIAFNLFNYMRQMIISFFSSANFDSKDSYKLLEQIKQGDFNEFINLDSMTQ